MSKPKLFFVISAIFLAAIAFFVGRSTAPQPMTGSAAGGTEAAVEPEVWTCSMHPSILQPDFGDCPICGMDLIPLDKSGGGDEGPREMSMSEASRALAEIQTTEVIRDYPEMEVRLVGKLEYDETREKSLTARYPARIDELYVNFKGIRVKRGEHLAKVYSPELLSAQRELLSAFRSDPTSSFTRSSREKLRLWDLLPEQIEAILERGEAQDHFELKAPVGGVVVEKHVKEGDYLKTGETLFKIVDLSRLWAFFDAYESDLPWLRFGQEVELTVESFPGETFKGTITFIEPEVDRSTRTIPVRVNVSNDDGRLKPGMFARAIVHSRLTESGGVYAPELSGKWISPMHPEIIKDGPGDCDVCGMDLVPAEELGYVNDKSEKAPLLVPASAVLRTGKRAVVYIQKMDTERPSYQGREIVLGPRAGDHFIVESGLEEGQQVVTHGAFKIDSALQIQAKPSMMNPDNEEDMRTSSVGPELDLSLAEVELLLSDYLKLQSALAGDDIATSKKVLTAMMEVTGHEGDLPDLIHTMMAAEALDAMRKPNFEILSNAFINVVTANPEAFKEDLYIMHCPMVYGDTGADWIQDNDELLNPYFGAMMLRCGELKQQVGK